MISSFSALLVAARLYSQLSCFTRALRFERPQALEPRSSALNILNAAQQHLNNYQFSIANYISCVQKMLEHLHLISNREREELMARPMQDVLRFLGFCHPSWRPVPASVNREVFADGPLDAYRYTEISLVHLAHDVYAMAVLHRLCIKHTSQRQTRIQAHMLAEQVVVD